MDGIMLKNMNKTKRSNLITYAIVIVAFVVMQILSSTGSISSLLTGLLVPLCTYIILAVSLNLVVGILGELSLGHAGFMSVGAYASAVFTMALTDRGIELPAFVMFVLALFIGCIAAAITGILVGIPALRLRGDYLCIVTVAFAEIIRVIFCNLEMTGGGRTLSGIPSLSNFYWVFWVMVLCDGSVCNSDVSVCEIAFWKNGNSDS